MTQRRCILFPVQNRIKLPCHACHTFPLSNIGGNFLHHTFSERERHQRGDGAERSAAFLPERALRGRRRQREVVVGLLPRVLLLPPVKRLFPAKLTPCLDGPLHAEMQSVCGLMVNRECNTAICFMWQCGQNLASMLIKRNRGFLPETEDAKCLVLLKRRTPKIISSKDES